MSKAKVGQKVELTFNYNPENIVIRQGNIYTVNEEDGVFGVAIPIEYKNGVHEQIEYPLVFGTTEKCSGTLVTVTAI